MYVDKQVKAAVMATIEDAVRGKTAGKTVRERRADVSFEWKDGRLFAEVLDSEDRRTVFEVTLRMVQ